MRDEGSELERQIMGEYWSGTSGIPVMWDSDTAIYIYISKAHTQQHGKQ